MRVALVVEASSYGGAEEYARQLLQHVPPRAAVTLVASEAAPERLTAAARSVVLVPAEGDGRAVPAQLAATLKALEPDVVHVNCVNAQHERAALDVAAGVAPAVATLHLPLSLHGVPELPALSATYRRLTAVVAVSEDGRRLLVDGLGVPPGRVHVVRNGVDVPAHVDAPRPGRPHLLSVARLDRQKGLDVLLAALASLPAARRPASLTVLGEGPERQRLEQLAAPLRSQGLPVHLPGESDDVLAALRLADLFCLPSREEGLPLALLEAMAAGLPCVATDVGDVATAVAAAAVVVPPQDHEALAAAVGRLVADDAARSELARTARAHAVAELDVRRTVEETTRVWERVFRQRAAGQGAVQRTAEREGCAR